jgi:hypothetical protein
MRAQNPRAPDQTDQRSVEELIEIIRASQQEIAEALTHLGS